MSSRQLESRIGSLRAIVRRLLALHGLSWVLGLLLPLVILAGAADWLFHLDAVIRAALLLALGGAIVCLGYRFVLRPLFVRFADLDIAMRIEERWPGLNDRLASTIQFQNAGADSDRYGSPELRAATVRQAEAEASTIDFREVIEPKPVLLAVGLAGLALFLGGFLVVVSPGTSRLAMRGCFCRSPATSGRSRPTFCSTFTRRRSRSRGAIPSACRSRSARRQGPGIGHGDLSFRRRSRIGRAAALRRGGRVPRPDRVGQPAVPLLRRGRG